MIIRFIIKIEYNIEEKVCFFFCLYMLSILVLRQKIGISKNLYGKVTLGKNRISDSIQENCNQSSSKERSSAPHSPSADLMVGLRL